MKVEFFSSVQELKSDRVQRTASAKEIYAQKKFVKDLKKARDRNLQSDSSISS